MSKVKCADGSANAALLTDPRNMKRIGARISTASSNPSAVGTTTR